MAPAKLKDEQVFQQREQVIETFSKQVSLEGLRAANMLGLAKSMGISTKTLYKHFPTKADLLEALVTENIQKFNQRRIEMLMQGENAHKRIEIASLHWLDLQTHMGERLLHEMRRDFPSVYKVYEVGVAAYLQHGTNTLKNEIRDDLNKDYALVALWEAINKVPASEVCENFGLTRKQALIQSITIWARGSLKMYL